MKCRAINHLKGKRMAESARTVYAEIRVQLDALSKDVNAAKERLKELDKLKVTPLEVALEMKQLDKDIALMKKQLKEFSMQDVQTPELRLQMEQLEQDIAKAKAKKKELSKQKIVPAEVRLEMDKLQASVNAAKSKFDDLKGGAEGSFSGISGKLGKMGQSVAKAFEGMGKSGVAGFSKIFQGIQKAILKAPVVGAILLIVGLIKKLVSGVQKMINRFNEWLDKGMAVYQAHNTELARMQSVLQATGQAAWTSTRQLAQAAEELARNSQFAQNEIMKMQSTLLAFGTVVGETFDRAQMAIADMASALGTNLDSAARSVGRALADPANATRALQREGVILGATQKELIENFMAIGDKAAAQNVILEEMEGRFAGAAEAIGSVGGAQARLAMAEERLARAQGELTASMSSARDNMRARRKELRAAEIETELAARAARQRQRDGYSAQMAELARLRQAIQDAGDDWEKIAALEDREQRLAVELEIQEAEDRLARLDRRFGGLRTLVEDFGDTVKNAVGGAARKALDALIAPWRQLGGAISNAAERVAGWGRSLAETVPVIGAVADASSRLLDATIRRRRIQREAAEEQRAQAQEELEQMQARAAAQAMYDAQTEAELKKIADLNAQLNEIEEARVRALEEARMAYAAGIITAEELHNRKTAAYQNEANSIIRLQALMQGLEFNTRAAAEAFGTLGARAETALGGAASSFQQAQQAAAAFSGAAGISHAEFVAQLQGFNTELRRAMLFFDAEQRAGRMAAEEHQAAVLRAHERAVSQAEALAKRYGISWEQNTYARDRFLNGWREHIQDVRELVYEAERQAELHEQREAAMECIKSRLDDLNHEQAVANLLLSDEEDALMRLRYLQERRLLDAIRQSDEYRILRESDIEEHQRMADEIIATQKELNRSLAAIQMTDMLRDYQNKLAQLNMSTRQSIEVQREHARAMAAIYAESDPGLYHELIAAIDEYYRQLKRQEGFRAFRANTQKYLSEALNVVNAFVELWIAAQRRQTADYIAQLRRQRDERKRHYAEQLQETLFRLGLVGAATEAQFEEELRLAKETGNQRAIHEAHGSLARFQTEEKFREKKEETEREYQRRRAKAEYEAAMSEWRIRKVMAKANAAQAVLMAGMNKWPLPAVPMMTMAGAMGVAQIAAITQARPQFQPPQFASGGIVPGNSFRGDSILTRQNSGEMNLNTRQQRNLFDAIDNNDLGGSDMQPIVIPVYLDGDKIAEVVVNHINDRHYIISQASVL